MVSPEDIQKLPKREKLQVMEMIWADLSSSADDFESPGWHLNELKLTEESVALNEEVPIDWKQAKVALRSDR